MAMGMVLKRRAHSQRKSTTFSDRPSFLSIPKVTGTPVFMLPYTLDAYSDRAALVRPPQTPCSTELIASHNSKTFGLPALPFSFRIETWLRKHAADNQLCKPASVPQVKTGQVASQITWWTVHHGACAEACGW
jgi:hypothetical protein